MSSSFSLLFSSLTLSLLSCPDPSLTLTILTLTPLFPLPPSRTHTLLSHPHPTHPHSSFILTLLNLNPLSPSPSSLPSPSSHLKPSHLSHPHSSFTLSPLSPSPSSLPSPSSHHKPSHLSHPPHTLSPLTSLTLTPLLTYPEPSVPDYDRPYVIRSKGFFWLASRTDEMMLWYVHCTYICTYVHGCNPVMLSYHDNFFCLVYLLHSFILRGFRSQAGGLFQLSPGGKWWIGTYIRSCVL